MYWIVFHHIPNEFLRAKFSELLHSWILIGIYAHMLERHTVSTIYIWTSIVIGLWNYPQREPNLSHLKLRSAEFFIYIPYIIRIAVLAKATSKIQQYSPNNELTKRSNMRGLCTTALCRRANNEKEENPFVAYYRIRVLEYNINLPPLFITVAIVDVLINN